MIEEIVEKYLCGRTVKLCRWLVWRPSQYFFYIFMSRRSVYLTTLSWAGRVLPATCAHSFTRNWQLPLLNPRKGENDHRNISWSRYMRTTNTQIDQGLRCPLIALLDSVEAILRSSGFANWCSLSPKTPFVMTRIKYILVKKVRVWDYCTICTLMSALITDGTVHTLKIRTFELLAILLLNFEHICKPVGMT